MRNLSIDWPTLANNIRAYMPLSGASKKLGFEMVGCELDQDYYEASIKRIEKANNQASLFEPKPVQVKPTQEALL